MNLTKEVELGVPQGSILGPLLFIIYINDLSICTRVRLMSYADDTTAIVTEKCMQDLKMACEQTIIELEQWFAANGLQLNKSKTGLMHFSPSLRKNNELVLNIDINNITSSASLKLLGIWFGENLKWGDHISQLSKRLNSVCFNMSLLKYVTNFETRLVVYMGYFYSLMKYGILLWGVSPFSLNIFKIQKRIVRIMTGAQYRASCKPIFIKHKLLTFPCVYIYELLQHVQQNKEFYRRDKTIHKHRTRNCDLLIYPTHRLSLYEKSPYYMGIKLYNKLPRNIKDVPFSLFKNRVRELLLSKAYYSVSEYLHDVI